MLFLLHCIEEVDSAINIAVVGHGRGLLTQLAEVACKFIDVASSVKKRVVGVQVEMRKLGGHTSMLSLKPMRKTRP